MSFDLGRFSFRPRSEFLAESRGAVLSLLWDSRALLVVDRRDLW